jgi:hypothetical protein
MVESHAMPRSKMQIVFNISNGRIRFILVENAFFGKMLFFAWNIGACNYLSIDGIFA